MRVFLWSGVAMVVVLIIVQRFVMGFVSGASRALGAEKFAQISIPR